MNRTKFIEFLLNDYRTVSNTRMTPKAASDCASRAQRVEALLGIDLDETLASGTLGDVTEAISDYLGDLARRDCKTSLNRYAEFINHERKKESRRKA